MSDPGLTGGGAIARFFGWMLIVIGGLIGGLCGLCTLAFIGIGVTSGSSGSDGQVDVVLALVVGGLPTLVGLGIAAVGIGIVRSNRAPKR